MSWQTAEMSLGVIRFLDRSGGRTASALAWGRLSFKKKKYCVAREAIASGQYGWIQFLGFRLKEGTGQPQSLPRPHSLHTEEGLSG